MQRRKCRTACRTAQECSAAVVMAEGVHVQCMRTLNLHAASIGISHPYIITSDVVVRLVNEPAELLTNGRVGPVVHWKRAGQHTCPTAVPAAARCSSARQQRAGTLSKAEATVAPALRRSSRQRQPSLAAATSCSWPLAQHKPLTHSCAMLTWRSITPCMPAGRMTVCDFWLAALGRRSSRLQCRLLLSRSFRQQSQRHLTFDERCLFSRACTAA